MTERGRIAWRWLWCWLSVLAAGCGQRTPIDLSPLPAPTLLGYTRIPPTLTPILRILRTPSPSMAASHTGLSLTPQLTPQPLTLDPPSCYETPVGSLWCLGLVRNLLPITVESVMVRVYLVALDGSALAQRDGLIARPLIRPNESAPYGVLFDHPPAVIAGSVVELLNATRATRTQWTMLTVQQTRGDWQASGYHVSAQLVNASKVAVKPIAVVTLFDANQRVIGFRQFSTENVLDAGLTLPLALDVAPNVPVQLIGAVHYAIAADGESTR